MTRVFVTGIGVLSAGGRNEEEFKEFLLRGGCGIKELTRVNTTDLYYHQGGEVDLDRDDFDSPAYQERTNKLALLTAAMALKNAGLDLSALDPGSVGVVLGTTCGGMESQEEWVRRSVQGRPASQAIIESSFFHSMAGTIARAYRIRGPVTTVTIACAAGTNAIGYGFDLIRRGRASVVLAGGVDVVTQLTFAGFSSLRAITPDVCRPFDVKGNGIALGDGCGILVLEDEEFARSRGARLRAEVLGYGICSDGYHGTTPHPEGRGLVKSMRHAMQEANVAPGEIDYVNLHGTGTKSNDLMESAAMRMFFGERSAAVPASSTKSMVGHTLGAAGAVETIASILGMENGFLPPSVNVTGVAPESGVNLVQNTPLPRPMRLFMNMNAAFAGNNAVVVIRKPGEAAAPKKNAAPSRPGIVITGMGMVLPMAMDQQAFWEVIIREESAIAQAHPGDGHGEFKDFDFCRMSGIPSSVHTRQMDRYAALSVLAAQQTMLHAGWKPQDEALEDVGSIVGSGYGCIDTNTKFFRTIVEQGNRAAKPVLFQKTVSNTASGFISILLGARGINTTLNNGDIAGLEAIHYAHDLIALGKADVLYAGGVDNRSDIIMDAFRAREILASNGRSGPFGADSGGTRITEGAGGVMLETRGSAERRGARIYAEVLGWGRGFIGEQSFVDALVRSMNAALRESGLRPSGIDLVIAHANGVQETDAAEWEALSRVFAPGPIRVTSIKGKVGESMGTGGVCSLIAAVQAAQFGAAPGMGKPAGRTSTVIVPIEEHTHLPVRHVLVNALDAGGGVITAVIRGEKQS